MPTAPRRTTARTETPGTTTTTTDETAEVAPSATADDTPSSGRATATKRTAQSRTARKNDTARTDTATGGTVADTATTDLARTGTATDRPAGVPTPGTAAETATSDQATGQAQAAARALTGTAGWRRTRWSGQPERRRGGGRYGGRHRVGCRDLAAHGRHHAGDGGPRGSRRRRLHRASARRRAVPRWPGGTGRPGSSGVAGAAAVGMGVASPAGSGAVAPTGRKHRAPRPDRGGAGRARVRARLTSPAECDHLVQACLQVGHQPRRVADGGGSRLMPMQHRSSCDSSVIIAAQPGSGPNGYMRTIRDPAM